ncbi:hypothetical protein [Brevibacillus borstelensis]|uniref:hypothetical protein n=1 Tax=Brevibacillus borstelensis TaxID=45462 RepID=UPI0030C62432
MSSAAFLSAVTKICMQYTKRKLYAGTIPQKILNNVYAHYTVPREERVIAVLDFTLLGSGKDGVAITDSGLYWKLLRERTFISWEELEGVEEIRPEGKWKVDLGRGMVFEIVGSPLSNEEMARFLQKVVNALQGNGEEAEEDGDTEQGSGRFAGRA